jgi:uncharacterized protein
MRDKHSTLREVAARAFAGEPVVFGYLFGSEATGKTHPRSDVDVAVYLEASVPRDRYLDYRLKLPALLEQARVGNVEVLILNAAPLPIRGRAIRDGKVFYSRDDAARVLYQSKTLREFFDFEIHSRPLDEKFLRDIAAGRR